MIEKEELKKILKNNIGNSMGWSIGDYNEDDVFKTFFNIPIEALYIILETNNLNETQDRISLDLGEIYFMIKNKKIIMKESDNVDLKCNFYVVKKPTPLEIEDNNLLFGSIPSDELRYYNFFIE